MNPLIQTLSRFNEISEELENELLSRISCPKILKRNEFLVQEGKYCRQIVFIIKGMIRHFYYTDKGEVTRWISLENNFCTSLASFIKEIPSTENLQAITDTEMIIIQKKELQELFNKYPLLFKIWSQFIESHYLGMEERVFSLIALNAEERYGRMLNSFPEFILKVPNKYIASMLGIEPRHLSRIKTKI